MEIATGASESHPTQLPLDESQSPAVARPTATAGQLTPADQGGVFDAARDQSARLAGMEADVRGAQSAGMAAENSRRDHYAQDVLPQGASYGDLVTLPVAPPNVVPAEGSDLHPWSGDEPVPSGVGFYHPPGSMPQ